MPHVLVTRPAEGGDGLERALAARGIGATRVPTVAIDIDAAAAGLDAALRTLDGAAWLIVTSANGAVALRRAIDRTGISIPGDTRVAAVGPATAAELAAARVRVTHVPHRFVTTAIAAGLGDVHGRRIVLARADAATPELHDDLVARGAHVEEVVAYRTIEGPTESRVQLHEALQLDLAGIAFTSGSTVRGLLTLATDDDRELARAIPAFCIGPVTAAVADGLGFRVAAIGDPHTAGGLAAAIANNLVVRAR